MNDNQIFDFMIKEYELLYSKFEMHYSAVEKTIVLYLVTIAAIISANSFLIKSWDSFSIFSLNNFQLICLFFISIVGIAVIMKVIEHRLLIVAYVKSVNLVRKWFVDNANNDLGKYLFWKPSVKHPKFYKAYRHFYWEVLGISIINSSFSSLFIINCLKHLNFTSRNYTLINYIFFLVFSIIFSLILIRIYKKRGYAEENRIATRTDIIQ